MSRHVPLLRWNRGWTPLHRAAWSGRADIARTLLDAGADPNAADRDGTTPLNLAEHYGNMEIHSMIRAAGGEN